MRLLFFGAGEFGLPTFEALRQQHDVAAVVSQPDRPAGRHRKLTPPPVAQWALDQGLPVLQRDNVNTPDFVSTIQALNVDAAVVIAFGQKLSPELIAASGRLVVNLHSSLLPRYRGAAPINWAVLNGDEESGVSVISLAQQMDAGLIYAQRRTSIDPLETAGQLHDRLALMGPDVIAQVLDDLQAGTLAGEPQDASLATRAPKLSKADSPIDFTLSAKQVRNRIHGLTPWPGATAAWHRQGQDQPQQLMIRRVRVVDESSPQTRPGLVKADGVVACGQGEIRLLEVQLPGKRIMTLEEFIRGNPLLPGDHLQQG
jgi:methionyl-tRNA formyltransferase